MAKYALTLMYFGQLSVPHQLLYSINITETAHTEIITQNGMNSKQQAFSSRPAC
jgi:hypothetical protein